MEEEIEYKIVTCGGGHDDMLGLYEEIARLLNGGWELHGGVSVSAGRYTYDINYAQALIRKKLSK